MRLSAERRQYWERQIRRERAEADRWLDEHWRALGPEEIELGVSVPASGAAESFPVSVEHRRKAIVWDNWKRYEREVRTYVIPYAFLPKMSAIYYRYRTRRSWPSAVLLQFAKLTPDTSPKENPLRIWRHIGDCKYPITHSLPTIENIPNVSTAERERAMQLRKIWKFGLLTYILDRWYLQPPAEGEAVCEKPGSGRVTEAAKNFMGRDDSPFCAKQNAKREKRRAQYKASRLLYTPWLTEQRLAMKVHAVDARLERWLRDLDNGQEHERAEHKAEEITHECLEDCQCHEDWRPFTSWRPWQDPPEEVLRKWEDLIREIEYAELCEIPLPLVLQRILKVHRATYHFEPYRDRPETPYHQTRVDAERRRLQLRSWVNGCSPAAHICQGLRALGLQTQAPR